MAFTDRLKMVRKCLKLKQYEMAKRLDIQYVTYNKYEVGVTQPNIEYLGRLNRIFNVNINWLITGVGSMFVLYEDSEVIEKVSKLQGFMTDITEDLPAVQAGS